MQTSMIFKVENLKEIQHLKYISLHFNDKEHLVITVKEKDVRLDENVTIIQAIVSISSNRNNHFAMKTFDVKTFDRETKHKEITAIYFANDIEDKYDDSKANIIEWSIDNNNMLLFLKKAKNIRFTRLTKKSYKSV